MERPEICSASELVRPLGSLCQRAGGVDDHPGPCLAIEPFDASKCFLDEFKRRGMSPLNRRASRQQRTRAFHSEGHTTGRFATEANCIARWVKWATPQWSVIPAKALEILPLIRARFAKSAAVRDNGALPQERMGQRARTDGKMLEAQTKFELGQIVVTPAASAALEAHGQHLTDLLTKHQSGDWGRGLRSGPRHQRARPGRAIQFAIGVHRPLGPAAGRGDQSRSHGDDGASRSDDQLARAAARNSPGAAWDRRWPGRSPASARLAPGGRVGAAAGAAAFGRRFG